MRGIKHCFSIIENLFQYKAMITQIKKSNFQKLLIFSLIVVAVGQVGNIIAINRFPAFSLYQLTFLIILYIAYYSIYFFNNKLEKFDILTAGEESLVGIRFFTKVRRLNNINWLCSFSISSIILLVIHILFHNYALDDFMRIYCYSALFVIVFISTMGYTQFIVSVQLVIKVANNQAIIKNYDKILPYNTEWVKMLSDMVYKGSSMFFLVGLFYILLFYGFCFTGLFYVDVKSHWVLITLFWISIIIFIVVAFPLLLGLSVLSINKLVSRLKNQRKNNLILELSHLQNNILLKYLYMNTLISLDNTPNRPDKPVLINLASIGIGIINFLASIQACLSLIQIMQ